MLAVEEKYQVTLPNRAKVEVKAGVSYQRILEEHLPNALPNALGVKVDEKLFDLSREVGKNHVLYKSSIFRMTTEKKSFGIPALMRWPRR